MERHNTHILSDSQEEEDKEENNHFYEFNDTKNSESNSLKNTIQSNTKKESKFSLNELIQNNNNDEKELINDSLISSRDLEDIFYNEKRFIKKPEIIKDNNKDKNEDKNNEKENNNNKNKNPENVKIKMIKLNYDDNLSILNKYLISTPYLINRLKLKKIKRKRNCVSFEKIKEKPKPKLKLPQSSEDTKKSNKISKKKKKINIPPQSDSNSEIIDIKNSISSKEEEKKVKNLYDILKSKNLKLLKISQDSFMINQERNKEDNDDEKLNNFKKKVKSMNSLAKLDNKIQRQNDFYLKQNYEINSLKRNYFSPGQIKINGSKRFEISQEKKKENKYNNPEYNSRLIISNDNNSTYSLRYHNNSCSNQDYIRKVYNYEFKNNDFNENEKDYCKNNFIDDEYNGNYNNNHFYENNYNRNNNYNENYIACMNRMKKMNLINNDMSTKSNQGLKLGNDRRIKILYDLYCKQPNREKKIISRINSAFSIKNRSNYKNGYNYLELNGDFENNGNIFKRRLYKENNNNNKNWLLKLLRVQKEKNKRHYEKHFGNNDSCPLCQQMDKKNEEQIKKIGVFHIPSDYKKSEPKSTSKQRRINSAHPNFIGVNVNLNFAKENELINFKNKLHFNKSSALLNESNKKKKIYDINQLQKKILLKKQRFTNNNCS